MILGRGDKRVQVVAELREEYDKLNRVLQKQVELQKEIKSTLDSQKGGASAKTAMAGARAGVSGFLDEPGSNASASASANGGGTGGSASGMNWGGAAKAIIAGAVGGALQALPRNEQYIENRIALQRGQFFGGRNLGGRLERMMYGGTAIDPMDAARASMAGNSMGMMTGLSNYSTITGSAAQFSNLVPGAGLEGGMRATAALNQAGSVNRLRMLGINVRDGATGLMRSFDDIAKDLWKVLNQQKTGSGKITKEDLALSLQPGNALDGLLNQYFGNDPVLRQGVVTSLFQFAGGGGIDQKSLVDSGALPDIAYSSGQRDAGSYKGINAYTDAAIDGIIEANTQLQNISEKFAGMVDKLDDVVKQIAKANQLMGGGNGGMGTFLGGLLGGLGALGIGGAVKGMFGGAKSGITKLGSAIGNSRIGQFFGRLPKWAKFGGRAALAAGSYYGLEKLQAWLNERGEDLPEWLQTGGNFAFDLGQGALTGAIAAGPGGAVAGTVAGGVGSLMNPYGGNGDGHPHEYGMGGSALSGDVSSMQGVVDPLQRMDVTSPFGVVRHLTYGNRKSPTYGREHGGVDLAASVGTPTYAVKDGVVESTSYDAPGFGNYVRILHNDGHRSYYGHLSQKLLGGGQPVKAGDIIGYTGNSGFSTGPHLHFEVRNASQGKVDPLQYISASGGLSGSATSIDSKDPSLLAPQNAAAPQALSGVSLFAPGATKALFSKAVGDGPSLGIDLKMPNFSGGVKTPRTKATNWNTQPVDTTSTSSNVVNYGGVTVNVHVAKEHKINEKDLAYHIKKVLNDQNQMKRAVTR
jgi:murein DD-endopeptidase MepM/ murein hydrolase activator NlpD